MSAQILGQGQYGKVMAVDDDTVAKVFFRLEDDDEDNEGVPPTTLREISILKKMDHPNIVRLSSVGTDTETGYPIMFMERMHCNLAELMDTHDHLDAEAYMRQLLSALAYCHRHQIMHRDVKPANILVSADYRFAKLADFGMARFNPIRYKHHSNPITGDNVVTLWYRPPEVLLGDRFYGVGVDVWSLGCVFVELLRDGQTLVPGENVNDQLCRISRVFGTPKWKGIRQLPGYDGNLPKVAPPTKPLDIYIGDRATPEAQDLATRMLCVDPRKRISAADALRDPYFGLG